MWRAITRNSAFGTFVLDLELQRPAGVPAMISVDHSDEVSANFNASNPAIRATIAATTKARNQGSSW
jgi:hypothetical protein